MIRQIDEGADTASQSARTVVLVFLGLVGAIIVIGIWAIVHSRKRRKAA